MSSPAHAGRRVVAATATLAAVAVLATAPARAAGTTSATCVHQFTTTVSPGFSLVPSSGTQTTYGETGTIACVGRIAGRRITGPGTIGYDMPYAGATCASETGAGTVRLTVPTIAGDQHYVGALTVHRTALAIRADVQFAGMRYRGTGVGIPRQGLCPVTTMRKVLIVLAGTLSGT